MLLNIKNLTVSFRQGSRLIDVVRDVELSLAAGETLALVGESGCGKTMTALSIMRLLPDTAGITQGLVLFEGEDLVQYSAEQLRAIRGKRISMVFQEPLSSLNPVLTIGAQVCEVFTAHRDMAKEEIYKRVIALLEAVELPDAAAVYDAYPHTLSGGMRQRVMIAMALALEPSLIILDEPTTALDVTIQAQIVQLLQKIKRENDTSFIFITHDLGVAAELADTIAVMYAGEIVEYAPADIIFARPSHPYTKALLASLPPLTISEKKLAPIAGNVPDLAELPAGCVFHPRCSLCEEQCRREAQRLETIDEQHKVRCWKV